MNGDYLDYMPAPDNTAGKVNIAQLQVLAEQQARMEAQIKADEEALDRKRKELQQISEVQIPEIMDSIGILKFETNTGLKISVNETIRAAIPKDKLQDAIGWLDKNGHSNLVKRKVSVNFGRGENDKAGDLIEVLEDKHLPFDDSATVHPSTLSAFVREMLSEGEDLPLDLLGVYRQRITKIDLPA